MLLRMATEASPPKKHKVSRDMVLKGKKKKKDHKSRSDSVSGRSKKNKDSIGKAHKSRSLSELVELVSTGAIQIPQSLMSYVEDKSQLLDQIFTILASDDIKEMLPESLKGCKVKHVKMLCYEQLKKMATKEIRDILLSPPLPCGDNGVTEVATEAVLNKRVQNSSQSTDSDMECEQVTGMECEQAADMECEQGEDFSDISESDRVSPGRSVVPSPQAEDRIVVMPDVSGDELDNELTQRDVRPAHVKMSSSHSGSSKECQRPSRDHRTVRSSKGGHSVSKPVSPSLAPSGGGPTPALSRDGLPLQLDGDHQLLAAEPSKDARPTRDTGSSKDARPTRDTGSNKDARPTRDTGSNKDARPTRDTGSSKDTRPTRDTGSNMDARPTRDTGSNMDAQLLPSGEHQLSPKDGPLPKKALPPTLPSLNGTAIEVVPIPSGNSASAAALKEVPPALREVPLSASLIVESAQLVEMELRKRALESELKRAKKDDKPLPPPGNHGDLESLEMRLRQRALQSFLAKKEAVG